MTTRRETLVQLVKFGLVGVANTAVYYVVYRLLLTVWPYLPSHLLAFGVGIVFSFFMNCLFTYRVRPTWRRFVLFPLTTVPNLVIQTLATVVLVEGMGVSEQWATLVAAVLAIPVTFLLARFILTGRHNPDRAFEAAMGPPAGPA